MRGPIARVVLADRGADRYACSPPGGSTAWSSTCASRARDRGARCDRRGAAARQLYGRPGVPAVQIVLVATSSRSPRGASSEACSGARVSSYLITAGVALWVDRTPIQRCCTATSSRRSSRCWRSSPPWSASAAASRLCRRDPRRAAGARRRPGGSPESRLRERRPAALLLVGAALAAGCGGARPTRHRHPATLLAAGATDRQGRRLSPAAGGTGGGRMRSEPRARARRARRGVRRQPRRDRRGRDRRGGPTDVSGGTVTRARCYGDLVTLDPTGVVLVRRNAAALCRLFRAWGQPLSSGRLASFRAGAGSASPRSSTDAAGRGSGRHPAHLAMPRSCSRSARMSRRILVHLPARP